MSAVTEDVDANPSVVPALYLSPPLLRDDEVTKTTEAQDGTLNECLPLLNGISDPRRNPFDFNEFGVPELMREDHIDFLHENLSEFPAPFVGLDASRPWLVYWGLLSLHLLGEDVSIFNGR
jgi:protein farnesyltransferase subunit beta